MKLFRVGDQVRFTRRWLRAIGAGTEGSLAGARGRVTILKPRERGFDFAAVEWDLAYRDLLGWVFAENLALAERGNRNA